jgi:enediyne biosynthesis protein E4
VNGHVDPQVEGQSFGVGYAEHPFLFHNLVKTTGKFEEVAAQAGPALAKKYVGRAALTADFWNRGRQDLLFTDLDSSPVLLRNEGSSSGHWLRIKTIGHKSNRDGYGAKVEVTVGNTSQYAEVRAGSSFESSSDPRLHFGLGAATRVDSIVVRWPSGQIDRIAQQPADQQLTIEEGRGVTDATLSKPPVSSPSR